MTKLKITHNFETVYGFTTPSAYMETNEYYTQEQININISTWISKEARDSGKQPIQLANFQTSHVLNKKDIVGDGVNIYEDEQEAIFNKVKSYLLSLNILEENLEIL